METPINGLHQEVAAHLVIWTLGRMTIQTLQIMFLETRVFPRCRSMLTGGVLEYLKSMVMPLRYDSSCVQSLPQKTRKHGRTLMFAVPTISQCAHSTPNPPNYPPRITIYRLHISHIMFASKTTPLFFGPGNGADASGSCEGPSRSLCATSG